MQIGRRDACRSACTSSLAVGPLISVPLPYALPGLLVGAALVKAGCSVM